MVIYEPTPEQKVKEDVFKGEVVKVKMMNELLKYELCEIKNDFNHLFR